MSEKPEQNQAERNKYCGEMYPIPFEYKGVSQFPMCILEYNHLGKHKTSPAYNAIEWKSTPKLAEEQKRQCELEAARDRIAELERQVHEWEESDSATKVLQPIFTERIAELESKIAALESDKRALVEFVPCDFKIGRTTCGYTRAKHTKGDGSPMDHEFTSKALAAMEGK